MKEEQAWKGVELWLTEALESKPKTKHWPIEEFGAIYAISHDNAKIRRRPSSQLLD